MIHPGRNTRRAWGCTLICAVLALGAAVADDAPLPQPLTLTDALALVHDEHPAVARGRADVLRGEAEQLAAQSSNDFSLGLRLHPRWVEPNDRAEDQSSNDSRVILRLSKPLYDFGRSSHAIGAAETLVRGREAQHHGLMDRQRLEIMRHYFQVLLADLAYVRDNEAMAIAFVTVDKARERNTLGQVSDIDLLAMEDHYQEARLQRMATLQETRSTRHRLALALNRPDQVPADLVVPALPGNDRPLPTLDELHAMALAGNRHLAGLRLEAEAASRRIASRRAERLPTLSAEVEAAHYERFLGGRDPLAAGLVLDVPLYSGRRVDAAVSREQAGLYEIQARIRQQELDLRQAVLETWLDIQRYHAQREQARVRHDYRDLYLDRSRALYELEVEADLGDAMTQQSAAMLFSARTEFELALAWERLSLLTGQPAFSPVFAIDTTDAP